MSLLDHPLISQRYFFPRRDAPAEPFWVDCGDARLACAYSEVAAAAPTLVHFHGNGEVVTDWQGDFVELVNHCGWNLLLAELRGYGASTGEAQLGRMLADVPQVLAATGKPVSELAVFGRSVGSIFAIEAVKRQPGLAGLVLESGVADVGERLLLRVTPAELGVSPAEFKRVVAETFAHQQSLAAFQGPSLVLHAEQDSLVDVSHGRRLASWIGGEVESHFFNRGDHNDILFANAKVYLAALKGFLERIC